MNSLAWLVLLFGTRLGTGSTVKRALLLESRRRMGGSAYPRRERPAPAPAPPLHLNEPSDILIYVVSGDKRPQGKCSAETWVSDALDFGFRIVYYGQNATHRDRGGAVIATRQVEDHGALSGVRDRYDVWPQFTANLFDDILKYAPEAKFIMRMDDDSFLHPENLWRSLKALPLQVKQDWMIGDCGEDEHYSQWCSGGAGIVMSRPLVEKLLTQLRAGYSSRDVCALVGRNDDDTMGMCATALHAQFVNHHGFHPWAPAKLENLPDAPWWAWWPRLNRLWGGPGLDDCVAEQLGPYAVVRDWITYHHLTCQHMHGLSTALRATREEGHPPAPKCAGELERGAGGRFRAAKVEERCKTASELTRSVLCNF